MTVSSLIQHGRPAEHHLLPKKLLIKSQLSFCKLFIENKIANELGAGPIRRRKREYIVQITNSIISQCCGFNDNLSFHY